MKKLILFLIPLVLLAVVIAVFIASDGAGLNVRPVVPLESIDIERIVLEPGLITLRLRNTGPEPVRIAQVGIKDSLVPFGVQPGPLIPRLAEATVEIPYPWVEAEAYEIRLITANSVSFPAMIEAATPTRGFDAASLAGFTLIGLYVGVIPVLLGLCWFPAVRKLGSRAFVWLMAFTIGLLLYLGIDAIQEALEQAQHLGSPLQGVGIVGIGAIGTFLLLDALAKHQAFRGQDEQGRSRQVAAMIALGIGLHNFGEGLAIGSAYSIGAATLGTFFVIGFILQNITEGLGIIAPIIKQQPKIRFLAGLGLLGGAPAIIGAWAGGLISAPGFSVLFLSVGAGAVAEVAYEITKLVKGRSEKLAAPLLTWSGVMAGMAVLYLTGLIVK